MQVRTGVLACYINYSLVKRRDYKAIPLLSTFLLRDVFIVNLNIRYDSPTTHSHSHTHTHTHTHTHKHTHTHTHTLTPTGIDEGAAGQLVPGGVEEEGEEGGAGGFGLVKTAAPGWLSPMEDNGGSGGTS